MASIQKIVVRRSLYLQERECDMRPKIRDFTKTDVFLIQKKVMLLKQ